MRQFDNFRNTSTLTAAIHGVYLSSVLLAPVSGCQGGMHAESESAALAEHPVDLYVSQDSKGQMAFRFTDDAGLDHTEHGVEAAKKFALGLRDTGAVLANAFAQAGTSDWKRIDGAILAQTTEVSTSGEAALASTSQQEDSGAIGWCFENRWLCAAGGAAVAVAGVVLVLSRRGQDHFVTTDLPPSEDFGKLIREHVGFSNAFVSDNIKQLLQSQSPDVAKHEVSDALDEIRRTLSKLESTSPIWGMRLDPKQTVIITDILERINGNGSALGKRNALAGLKELLTTLLRQ